MKATIDIPDEIYRRVKAGAALRGLTIRDVTTELYRRWLGEEERREPKQSAAAWLRAWLASSDEAVRNAPEGRPAREELTADRNRLDRR